MGQFHSTPNTSNPRDQSDSDITNTHYTSSITSRGSIDSQHPNPKITRTHHESNYLNQDIPSTSSSNHQQSIDNVVQTYSTQPISPDSNPSNTTHTDSLISGIKKRKRDAPTNEVGNSNGNNVLPDSQEISSVQEIDEFSQSTANIHDFLSNTLPNDTINSNSFIAAAVARSVIRATRAEFDRNAAQARQAVNLTTSLAQPLPNTNTPTRNENIWLSLQGNVVQELETGIGRFILDVLNSRHSNPSSNNPEEQREQAESPDETTDIPVSQQPEQNIPSDLNTNLSSTYEMNQEQENSQTDDRQHTNTENTFNGNLDGAPTGENEPSSTQYVEIPGSYQFRVFPIITRNLAPRTSSETLNSTNQTQQPRTTTSFEDVLGATINSTNNATTPIYTRQNSTSGLSEAVNSLEIGSAQSEQQDSPLDNTNGANNESNLPNTTGNDNTRNGSTNSESETETLETHRQILRQMLRSQNAAQQQIPVIIVGVQSRPVDETGRTSGLPDSNNSETSFPPLAPDSSTAENMDMPETSPHHHSRIRSMFSYVYDRVSRFIPLWPGGSSSSHISNNRSSTHTNQNSSNIENLGSGYSGTNTTGQHSTTTNSPLSNGGNGLIVYVFATSFELNHPLLLSFLVGTLFPGLMDTNGDTLLSEPSNGQLYDDFLAFADLLGQVRTPVASMADVEAQLPKYVYNLMPTDMINDEYEKINKTTNKSKESQYSSPTDNQNEEKAGDKLSFTDKFVDENLKINLQGITNKPEDDTAEKMEVDEETKPIIVGVGKLLETSDDMFSEESNEGMDKTTKKEKVVRLLSAEKCLVCLEEFKVGDMLRVLECRHGFHADCVANWITKGANKCPVCRAEAVKNTHPYQPLV
ncbi:hypothetical protein BB559_003614 [Furculomyces boomerangus]|uniref:RING-type E3 ubiquitin transferase n=1 Tax=Furculomyces boomerangus TaxID=61424 RepID=A0A2T9YK98_9FUNG|nr:hypothetical protein BB559_003614 [Furculomyces boomerangus]